MADGNLSYGQLARKKTPYKPYDNILNQTQPKITVAQPETLPSLSVGEIPKRPEIRVAEPQPTQDLSVSSPQPNPLKVPTTYDPYTNITDQTKTTTPAFASQKPRDTSAFFNVQDAIFGASKSVSDIIEKPTGYLFNKMADLAIKFNESVNKPIQRAVLPKELEYKLGVTDRPSMKFEVGEGLEGEKLFNPTSDEILEFGMGPLNPESYDFTKNEKAMADYTVRKQEGIIPSVTKEFVQDLKLAKDGFVKSNDKYNYIDTLGENLTASLLTAMNPDGATVAGRSFGDNWVRDAKQDIETLRETDPLSADLIESLAFSLSSQAAGFAAATGTGILTKNPILASVVAGGVSGVIAYRMSKYQIMQQYLETMNEESIATIGRPITLEEEKYLKEDFNKLAREYALWEAIPEMAAGGLGYASLLGPLKNMLGNSIGARVATGLGGLYIPEVATETVTQMGQTKVMAKAGFPGVEDVDWTSADDWKQAFYDVLPMTVILSTVLGGGATLLQKVDAANQEMNSKGITDSELRDMILKAVKKDDETQAEPAFKTATPGEGQQELLPTAPKLPTIKEQTTEDATKNQAHINKLQGFIKKKQNEIRFKLDGDGQGYLRNQKYDEISEIRAKIEDLKQGRLASEDFVVDEKDGPAFMTLTEQSAQQTTDVESSKVLEQFKKDKGVDFDTVLVDKIMTNIVEKGRRVEGAGASVGGAIVLPKITEIGSAPHEIMETSVREYKKIPALANTDMEAVLNEQRANMKEGATNAEVMHEMGIVFEQEYLKKAPGEPKNVTGKIKEFFDKIFGLIQGMLGLGKNIQTLEDFYTTLATSKVRKLGRQNLTTKGSVNRYLKMIDGEKVFDYTGENQETAVAYKELLDSYGGNPEALTIKFLQNPEVSGREFAGYQFLLDLTKSNKVNLRPKEQELIQKVMETQFKGQKKVKVADLSNAIIAELMPLEIIETDTYAGYGSENVGLQNADSKKTLLFNSPYLHGKPGHFPGDFDLDIDRNQIKVQEIPVGAQNPTEKFAVVRSDVTLTEDNIADNVFTLVATEEEAKGWISKRMHGDGENFRVKIDRPSGLFAHMRVWIDGDTLYVAEIQSDAFQSDNLMGVGFAGKIKDLQNDKAPHERNIQLHNKRIKEIESKSIIATKNDSDALSSNLYFITSFKGKGFGSINAGSASEAVEIFKSTSERAEELEEYTSSFSKKDIDDLISERNDKIKENEKNIADIDKEIKKLEDQYNMKENDAEKKFMNYRSDWHEMMVRQAIRYAAQKGLKKVRFPSTYGVALVEGYMDSGENGEGPAPYEFDGEELEVGDNLDFQGEDYTVVNIDSDYNVKIAPSKSVRTFMFSDYIQEEVESRYDEMIYSFNELEKDFGEIDTPEKAQKVLDANQIIKKTGEYNRIDDNIKDNKERFDTDPAHESVKNLQKEVDNYNKLIKLVKDDVIKKENITGEAIHNLGRKDELQEKYGVPHSFWNYMIDPWNEEDATMKTVKTETLEYIENRVIEVKKDFDVAKENLSDKQKKFEDSQRETKSRPKPTEAELKSIPPEYHNTKNTWFIDWEVEQMLEKMSESENEKVSIEDFEEDIKISMEESANDMDFQDMGYEEVFYNEQGYDTEVTTIDDGAIVEAVMQPGEYSTAPENVEDFDYTDEDMVSSDTNRTVLRFYDKQVNKYLAKLRKGNLEDVENENVPWIETNITEEDSAEVPAFKEKTTEPTSIEDEILKPKASIALFNPKSDTNVKTEEGYFTNKYWLLKPEFIPKTLASRIDNNMSMIKDKPKSEVLFESAREGDPQSVTNIIGYVKDRIRTSYILKSPNPIYGEYIEVNKEYYDYLAKNIKDFSLLGKDSASALIVMSGDKEAGLLMPIKGTEEDKIKFIEEMTTKEGDVVLDPFAGSGVTAAEAVKTGRRAVAIEKSPEAVEGVIKPRIEQALREVENIDDTPLTYTTQLEGPENTTVGEAKERLRYLNTLTGEEGGADEQAVASEEIEAIEKALGVVEKQTAGVTLKPKPVAPAARPVVAEVTKAAKPTERPSTKVVTEEKPGVVKDVKTEAKKLKSAVKDVKRVVKENSNLSKEYQKSLTEAIEKEGLPKIDVAEEFYPDNLGSNNPYTKFAVGWFNSLRDLVREHRWFPSWLKIKNSKELLAIAREKNRIIDGMKSVLQEDIVKPLKKLTQEEKLNIGLMVNKNIQVTEEYKGVVKNIDTAIGRLGKGIVDIYKEWEEKGLIKPNEVLLSEETFFENLGKYARTFYLRPDDIGNKIQPATVNPDMLSTSMFKRKLRDEEWGRKSILVEDGKVTDDSIELISHIGPKNVIKFRDAGLNTIEKVAEAEIKDIENALGPIQKNFADSIKNSAEKVLKKNEDNIIPAPSIKELEERGLEAKKNWGWVYEADIMVSKTFDDLTKNYATTQWLDNIVNNPLFFSKEPQQGFIKTSSLLPKGVKTNIKLGPLNSGYINEGLRDEVDHLIKTGNSTASEAYKNFRKVLSWWKWSKVAVNPPTMIRNLISGHIIQTDMAGYPVWYPENTIGYAKSFMDYAQKKGIYKEARAAGLYGSDFYSIEISPDIEKRLLEIESKKDVGSVLKSIVDAASKGKEVSGEFYGSIDHIARTYLYERARSQGAKKSQAVNFANKWELDYSLVPGVVELARNTGVVPFLSFYALMFPRVMEVSITRPWVLAKYSAVAVAVTAYMAAQMGMDDDELEAMKPEFLKGKPFVIPVGFDKNGDPEYMDFSYILPFGGGKELFVDFSQIEEMAKSIGIWSLVQDLTTNRDSFRSDDYNNVRIYEETDSDSVKRSKIAKHFAFAILPSFVYHGNNLINAWRGEVIGYPPFEKRRSAPQTLKRMFGMSVYSGGEWVAEKAISDKESLINDFDFSISNIEDDKNLSEKSKKKQIKYAEESIEKIEDEIDAIMDAISGASKSKKTGNKTVDPNIDNWVMPDRGGQQNTEFELPARPGTTPTPTPNDTLTDEDGWVIPSR